MPITTAEDNNLEYFFHSFSENIRLDISCESSARQEIHMNIKSYFLRKIKVKKINVLSAVILLGII